MPRLRRWQVASLFDLKIVKEILSSFGLLAETVDGVKNWEYREKYSALLVDYLQSQSEDIKKSYQQKLAENKLKRLAKKEVITTSLDIPDDLSQLTPSQ